MTTTTTREIKVALALQAYGIELRLWKEADLKEWGASLRSDNDTVQCNFEEDNLTLAKLRVLGEARNRAMSRAGSTELPGCNTFMNAWKPVNMARS
jgi:hypothetical protein